MHRKHNKLPHVLLALNSMVFFLAVIAENDLRLKVFYGVIGLVNLICIPLLNRSFNRINAIVNLLNALAAAVVAYTSIKAGMGFGWLYLLAAVGYLVASFRSIYAAPPRIT